MSFRQHVVSSVDHHVVFVDENCLLALYKQLNCVKRWLQQAPDVIKESVAPFTPTRDLNDADFIMHRSPEGEKYEQTFEPFDCSTPSKYFSVLDSDLGSSFNEEQANEYFESLIRKTKPLDDMETTMKEHEVAWAPKVSHDVDDNFIIGDELKTPEQMRLLAALDDPNRLWKNTRNTGNFIQQKIKNILEFRDLCKRSK